MGWFTTEYHVYKDGEYSGAYSVMELANGRVKKEKEDPHNIYSTFEIKEVNVIYNDNEET